MNINTHNYEEFFLLYVDDELNPQQRETVERFIATNPDMAEELERLKQTKFLPDEQLVFTDKESLLRYEEADVDMSNYEEYFLLYADNELTEKEKSGIQKFITQHPQLKDQFALLQQTVLQPEAIEFKNKELLYRTEEKERRVVPLKWIRIAVAAAVAGIIAMVLWLMPAANKSIVALNNQPEKPIKNAGVKTNKLTVRPGKHTTEETKESKIEVVLVKPAENKKKVQKITVVAQKNQTQADDNFASNKNQLQINKQSAIIVDKIVIKPNTDIAKIEAPVNKKEIVSLKPLEEPSSENIKTTEAAYATDTRSALTQQALYKELDTNDDDSRTLYVGSMQINKDKVRGFFKKASRIFGSKAKDLNNVDNGKLQVANFEVDTRKL